VESEVVGKLRRPGAACFVLQVIVLLPFDRQGSKHFQSG